MPGLSLVYHLTGSVLLNSTLLTLIDMNKAWNAITAIPHLEIELYYEADDCNIVTVASYSCTLLDHP